MTTIAIARAPEHRLYLSLRGTDLNVLHVRNQHGAQYFSATISGQTDGDRQLSGLLTALSSVPFRSQVYLHTPIKDLRERVRLQEQWPRELKTIIRRQNLQLSLGNLTRLEPFWQDMLTALDSGKLPSLNHLTHHALYTYAVTDGQTSYVAGLLYGEGQIQVYTHQAPGTSLVDAELGAALWAFGLISPGKNVALRHTHSLTRQFWDAATTYLEQHPGSQALAEQLSAVLGEKRLCIERPEKTAETTTAPADLLANAVRWIAGRALG